MTYDDLQKALIVFGLGERASLKEIKSRHRCLVKQFHPDTGNEFDQEQIQKVNEAYRILKSYVESYRFCFTEEEFYEQNSEQRLWRRFKDDPLWGKK